MSRALSTYARPTVMPMRHPEDAKRIEAMLYDGMGGDAEEVKIDWKEEKITFVGEVDGLPVKMSILMEALGKMFGIMQQHCITVRKSKKDSQIKDI